MNGCQSISGKSKKYMRWRCEKCYTIWKLSQPPQKDQDFQTSGQILRVQSVISQNSIGCSWRESWAENISDHYHQNYTKKQKALLLLYCWFTCRQEENPSLPMNKHFSFWKTSSSSISECSDIHHVWSSNPAFLC